MNKWLIKNIWWISFGGIFTIGILIVLAYCYNKNNYTLATISLSDWLSYFATCGTIGSFLYLVLDKVLGEKELNHLKWQSQIPFVTLTSPCDPTTNYCEINILDNETGFKERGNGYFSICNLGKITAYDIKIIFYSKAEYIESNIFNRHYIPYLPPLIIHSPVYNPSENVYEQSYSNREFVYSNYNVNPDTKEASEAKFEICSSLSNCCISLINKDEKYFFARIEYYSSFSKKHRYKITSTIKVNVKCSTSEQQNVIIKGITFLEYDYEDS